MLGTSAAFSWVVFTVATLITLPRIAPPDAATDPAVLEQLGITFLALTTIPHLPGLDAEGPGLVPLAWRRPHRLRALRVSAHICLSSVLGLSAIALVPASVDGRQVVGVWAMTWALSLIGLVWRSRRLAAAAPLIPVILMGLPGAWPWQANLIYNPAYVGALLLASSLALLIALAYYAWRGAGEDRHPV